jgi:hypothetical protein
MSKFFRKALKLSPALLGATLVWSYRTPPQTAIALASDQTGTAKSLTTSFNEPRRQAPPRCLDSAKLSGF